MYKIIFMSLTFILLIIACDNNKNIQDINENNDKKYDLSLISDDENKFYLLEGRIDDSNIYIYLNISKDKNKNNIKMNGLYYDSKQNKEFNISSNILDNNKIVFNFINPNNEAMLIGAFEGNIFQDGSIYGVFLDDGIYKKGVEGKFALSNDKINKINFITATLLEKIQGKDYDNNDIEYTYEVKEQKGLISSNKNFDDNSISIINRDIGSFNGKIASNIQELREILSNELNDEFNKFKKDSNINYERISTIGVEYIDDKIISFSHLNYLYEGSVNGLYGENTLTYLISSGERINHLSLLLKDTDDVKLKKIILDKFIKNNVQLIDGDMNGIIDIKDISLSSFKIKNTGIEFYWGMYEIAPRSDGIIRIYFTFEELKPFIKEDSVYAYLFD